MWEIEVYGTLSDNQIEGSTKLCPGINSTSFRINLTGTTYKWQLNTGSGFTDITDNTFYTGTNTSHITLNNISTSWYGYEFRCMVDGVYSNPVVLKFVTTWLGTANASWENPINWNCGALPDANTDVIINSGNTIINSNAMVRSLTSASGVSITVNTGYQLTITH